MKPTILFSVVAAGMLGATQAGAQDVAAGEALFQGVCKTCHGPKAQGMASFPKLSDKDAEFIVMRLEQYRAGEEVGANSALMMPMAAGLSDEDITNLAAYITSLSE